MHKTIILIAAALFAFAGAAKAQSNRVDTDYASSIVLPEKTAFVPGATTWLAFSQELADGWHVYWKNPGDSGLPLDLRWTLPEGFEAGEIIYPTPERILIGPLANFGHHHDPIFLVPVSVAADVAPAAAVELSVKATWLICEEICVPEDGEFTLSMPVATSAAPYGPGAEKVALARAAAPTALDGEATFAATAEALVISLPAPEGFDESAFFFPESEGVIEPAAEQKVTLEDGQFRIVMKPGFSYAPDQVETLSGVIAMPAASSQGKATGFSLSAQRDNALAGALAAANAGAVGGNFAGGNGAGGNVAGGNLFILLLAAFFGGALLNIMPCVFPIIFVKAASLMHSAQAERGVIRRHGVLYTLGVAVTFAAIGGLLLALRAGGEQLGWGFHLQTPWIVALSAYVLFLVGLNLSGVFEIGESLMNAGGGLADKGGDVGAFFTGALTVIVAAPCIGPLLSAPMGAAVFLPPFWGMMIFIVMALGLAAPYLLLSFVPSLGRMLPKPGAWMKTFKQLLAFPVFAAAAYFLWVLAQQTGGAGLALALFGAIILAFAAWLFGLSKGGDRRAMMVRMGAAAAAVLAVAPVTQLKIATVAVAESGGKHGAFAATAYDQEMIASYRAEGRPVFVDFTAAWCATCQFNKLTIFSKPSLAQAFEDNDVAVMVADWTLRDEEITKALEAFGANGVPLYVYYPPQGAPQILALPLTEKAILNAVNS